jgi:hypothetical protein
MDIEPRWAPDIIERERPLDACFKLPHLKDEGPAPVVARRQNRSLSEHFAPAVTAPPSTLVTMRGLVTYASRRRGETIRPSSVKPRPRRDNPPEPRALAGRE